MNVPAWGWFLTIGSDDRVPRSSTSSSSPGGPHVPSMRRGAVAHLAFYVGAAVLFGLFVWSQWGGQYAGEFYAGWLTEYSLSVDNLFVFLLIMRKLPGAGEAPAGGADDRDRHRDHPARHLHRPRRRRDQRVRVGLLHLRRCSSSTRRSSWPARASTEDDEFKENRFLKWVETTLPGDHGVPRGPTIVTRIDGKQTASRRCSSSSWPWARPTCSSPSTRSRRSTGSPRSRTSSSPRTSSR